MKENISALYSEYVIDGIPMELTPAMMLDSCIAAPGSASPFDPIIDESLDPELCTVQADSSKVMSYISMVKGIKTRKLFKVYPASCTRGAIARALIDALWRAGHFRLGDLAVRLDWEWPTDHIGDFAAFYESVSAAADYIDSLGLKISDYSFTATEAEAGLKVGISVPAASASGIGSLSTTADRSALSGISVPAAAAGLSSSSDCLASVTEDDDDIFSELPFRTKHPRLENGLLHPAQLVPDAASWLIYVPFDDCDYRLAGSLLAQALGISGAVAPQIGDADYFIDCYEVVRELVEDGIILSGTTVGDGGLMTAIKDMTTSEAGASIDLADLIRASGERDIIRLLFSEVPGAIFQIADIDYDYVDAELLLQDVAFYPLGHPIPGSSELRVHSSEKSGIQVILESIIRSQNSEGED